MENKINKREVEMLFGKEIIQTSLIYDGKKYGFNKKAPVNGDNKNHQIQLEFTFADGSKYKTKESYQRVRKDRGVFFYLTNIFVSSVYTYIVVAIALSGVSLVVSSIANIAFSTLFIASLVVSLIPALIAKRKQVSADDFSIKLKAANGNMFGVYDEMSDEEYKTHLTKRAEKLNTK